MDGKLHTLKKLMIFPLLLLVITACGGGEPASLADVIMSASMDGQTTTSITPGTTVRIHVIVYVGPPSDGGGHPVVTNAVLTITDHLPDGLSFISGPNTGWLCTAEGQDITCISFAQIEWLGHSEAFDIEIAVDPGLTDSITNTVQVKYGNDPKPENNSTTLTLIPLTPSITLTTEELDFQKAKNAGAGFYRLWQDNPGCDLGLYDALSNPYGGIPIDSLNQSGAVFGALCKALVGNTADFIAYRDFELKNGWKVKSVAVRFSTAGGWHDSEEDAEADTINALILPDSNFAKRQGFNLVQQPQPGDISPLLKAHIWSESPAVLMNHRDLFVYVKITIEGPMGADPYGSSPCSPPLSPVSTTDGPGCADLGNPFGDVNRNPVNLLTVNACTNNSDCEQGNICVKMPIGLNENEIAQGCEAGSLR